MSESERNEGEAEVRISAFPREVTPEKTVRLRWLDDEHGPIKGLDVVCRIDCPTGLWQAFSYPAESRDKLYERNKAFGDALLISWNVDGADGKPLPANGDGMTTILGELAYLIAKRYFDTLTGVTDPLGHLLPSGRPADNGAGRSRSTRRSST